MEWTGDTSRTLADGEGLDGTTQHPQLRLHHPVATHKAVLKSLQRHTQQLPMQLHFRGCLLAKLVAMRFFPDQEKEGVLCVWFAAVGSTREKKGPRVSVHTQDEP